MIPMSFCCQRLRCCGPMPTFGLSLCPSSSGYSRPQCILCTDVIHCIRFHYDGWHSNKAISSLNTVFIRPLQEKHSVKCTRKIRCQCCKFSRGMQFRVPHSMKMQEKMTPRNTHDGQSPGPLRVPETSDPILLSAESLTLWTPTGPSESHTARHQVLQE